MKLDKVTRTSFKRRGFFKTTPLRPNNDEFSIIINKPCRLEVIRVVKLKRLLKKFFKKNKPFRKKKATIFLVRNCPISKKAKNSRMGKGKGKYLRTLLRFNPNHKILAIRNIPHLRVLYFLKFLERRKFILSYLCNFKDKFRSC